MTENLKVLSSKITSRFPDDISDAVISLGELTVTLDIDALHSVCRILHDDFFFKQLIDLTVVDYLQFGTAEWSTDTSKAEGFSRGVTPATAGHFTFKDAPATRSYQGARFAVVIHLLSIEHNQRIRIKAFCKDDDMPVADSVIDIWKAVDWYEREAFDLFGVLFKGHPDLRRLLTDYGFIGHPFRKDFPLIGDLEMRYDPEQKRVIYEPVSIEPRVLVPRIIRDVDADNG